MMHHMQTHTMTVIITPVTHPTMAAAMVTIDVSTDWSESAPVVAPSNSVAEGVLISLTIDPV